MKKRGKKRSKVKKRVKKHKTSKKKKPKKNQTLSIASIIMSIISSIVFISYIIALIMTYYVNSSLLIYTYLAAFVIFIISLMGAGLSAFDLSAHPEHHLSQKTLYINLFIIVITFALSLINVL